MDLDPQFWWWFERAAGLVAWWALAASVAAGLVHAARMVTAPGSSAWVLAMHRWLGALAVVTTGLHLAGLVADSYVEFGAGDLLVPMASEWKPGPVAWGVVALYLLLAVELTSLVQRRLPKRLWRGVHASSFATFVLVGVHGATAGTDARRPLYVVSTVACAWAVLFLGVYRMVAGRRVHRRQERLVAARRAVERRAGAPGARPGQPAVD